MGYNLYFPYKQYLSLLVSILLLSNNKFILTSKLSKAEVKDFNLSPKTDVT